MQITLEINGQNKTFVAPFIKGRMVRRTIEISKSLNLKDLSAEELDRMVDYVVEVYGNQFTRDEFYDGIEAPKLLPTITDTLNTVIGKVANATEPLKDPNA